MCVHARARARLLDARWYWLSNEKLQASTSHRMTVKDLRILAGIATLPRNQYQMSDCRHYISQKM